MAGETKILFVTTALNSPLHTGCTIRTVNVCRQLSQNARVTMLAVSHFFIEESVEFAKKQFDAFEQIKLKHYDEFSPQRGRFLKKWHMHWPISRGIQADSEGQQLFKELLRQNDVVWFHTLSAAFPFRVKKFKCSIIDMDDLNMCKYDLRANQHLTPRLRMSARIQSYKWRHHEIKALNSFDRIVVCSRNDKAVLGDSDKIRVVPNGFMRPEQEPVWTEPDPLRLGFIGTLGYGPNFDGLKWFRDQVWPIIFKNKPGMSLRIIGSPPQSQYRIETEGFDFLGYVEDPTDEIRTWSAMIVPILYGGGTRIKIIDAFSKLCPVVATPTGAYGIQVTHGKDILLSDDPEQFARHCLELSASSEKGKWLAEQAWKLFTEEYTWDVIGKSIRNIIEELKIGVM